MECVAVLIASWASVAHAQPASTPSHEQPTQSSSVSEAIAKASARFGIPARWIVDVMQIESRGDPRALSPKGAIGLMQIMPATYTGLAARYGLGTDPWDIRNNIMAGAAYLRELYDRYGASGFLAAYNAGPSRWEDYRSGARPLPGETVRYLSRLAPLIGGGAALASGVSSQPTTLPARAAPIFVALNVAVPSVQPVTERERILRIIAENEAVLGARDQLFVARSGSNRSAEQRADHHASSRIDPASDTQPTQPSTNSAAVVNSLFAPHN